MQSIPRFVRWAFVCTFLILGPIAAGLVMQTNAVITRTVTNNLDNGSAGSLRFLVNQANTDTACAVAGNTCEIVFDSTFFATPQTIQLTSGGGLVINQSNITIDGFKGSGTGATGTANTAALGSPDNSTHNVIIRGIADTCCPVITVGGPANNFVLRGVVLNFGTVGVQLNGTGGTIEGNYIGTDGTGNASVPTGSGIATSSSGPATGYMIGGPTPAARNLISGTSFTGVSLTLGSNTVHGNHIGPNKNLTASLSGQTGIAVQLGASAIIQNNLLAGNSIGINSNANGVQMTGNVIGKSGLSNTSSGVVLTGDQHNVSFNTVAFNAGIGVEVRYGGTGNVIAQNSMENNTGLGIDVLTTSNVAGTSPNDADDPDLGGNEQQNFPVITSAVVGANGTATIGYTQDSANASTGSNRIEFFEADSTNSEGKRFLQSQCVNGADVAAGSITIPASLLVPNSSRVLATATSYLAAGCISVSAGTSEFSAPVIAGNAAPTALNDTPSTPEDLPITFDPRANDSDPEGDALTISGNTQPAPAAGSVTCTTTSCTFTPTANYNGPAAFTYTIIDGAGNNATATVTITVTAVNDPPVAVNDAPPSTPEDTPTTFDPRTNDTDIDGPSPITITGNSAPTSGSVTCTATSCTYTPATNFSGTATFTYTITDGAAPATATVTVTVTAVNDPPVANPDSTSTAEDTPVTIDPRVNDTDAESNPLTITGGSGPVNGAVTCTATSCTFTPAPNFSGTGSYTYTVTDGTTPTNGTVTVTVTAVNDPPTAAADSLSLPEDGTGSVNVLTNDTDPDGPGSLTVTANTNGALGTATCTAAGVCTYVANPNANGPDSFTYTVFDGSASSTGTVSVTITAVNDPPVANNDAVTVTTGVPFAINVVANDTDVESNPLTISGNTAPSNGSVSCSGSTCTYTSNAGYTGPDSFTYTISDGAGGTASATVNVTVVPSNAPPNAVDDSATTLEGRAVVIRVLANDSDPNGDPITITSFTQGTKGSVSCSSTLCTYTPNPGATGPDFFTYTIKDPLLASDTATVTINITPCPGEIIIFSPVDGATNVPTSGNLSFAGAASEHLVYFGPAGTGCSTEFAFTAGSSVSYSGLSAGREYEWRVEGRQPGCPRNTTGCLRFTTAGSCPAPPSLLTPAAGGTATSPVLFSWTAVPGATNYRVFISVNSGPSTEIGSTAGTNISLPVPDGSISWHVVATVTGCGDLRSPTSAFNACSVPGQPLASVVGESTSEQTYIVAWDFMASASYYEVQEATNAAFTDATTTRANGTAVSFTKISNRAAPFFYRVRAFSECAGVFGPYSPTIRVVIVTVPLPDDPNPNASVPTGSQLPVVMHVFIPGTPDRMQTFTARTDQPWAHVEPDHGALPPEGVTLNVTTDPTGLPNGTFTGTVIVTIDDGLGGSRQVTTGTTTKQVPVSINLVTPVVPLGAGTPNDSSMIIPVVGHLDGSDARWRSDVRLANTGDERLRYQLTLVPADITIGMKQTTLEVAPGDTTALDDIVRAWYGVGSLGESSAGYLEVRPLVTNQQGNGTDVPKATASTVLTSRTFSQSSAGTLGEFIPGVPFGNFIGRFAGSDTAQKVLSLQQIAQNDAFRTNVGLVEASGQAASALLSIFNAGGTKLAEIPVSLRANEQKQLNSFLASEGITSLSDGRIEVRVSSGEGKVTAYAAVVDNRSKDQLFVPAVQLGETQASKYVVAGVADLVSGSANWRSDLRIFNSSADTQLATLTLHPQNNSGSPITANITIFPGEVRILDNVVQNTFGTTNLGGAVHVTTPADSSLVVTGRTYHQTSNGHLGQFIEAVTPDEAIGNGERSLNILQAEDSVRFRTNVGIAEVSGEAATVEITVSFPDSKVAPIIRVPLAANEFRQIGLLRELNLGNVYNARISMKVVEGNGRITAYGSLIDMKTQDSTYVPAR